MTVYTFAPSDLLMLLGVAGFQPQDTLYLDSTLLNGLSQKTLEKAQQNVMAQGWVQMTPQGATLGPEPLQRLTRSVQAPQVTLSLMWREPEEPAEQTVFCNVVPTAAIFNQSLAGKAYKFESLPLDTTLIAEKLLTYCETPESYTGEAVSEVRVLQAQALPPIGAVDVTPDTGQALAMLENVVAAAGFSNAAQMVETLQGSRLMFITAARHEPAPAFVRTFLWFEKQDFRLVFMGADETETATLAWLNGPALKQLIQQWVSELITPLPKN